ncbi:MAG: GntR family transcriptional regulator, partial [Lachnospiraceae bacterium]|nr:GntR family transcriptional regulator [Lachnospiraceae bacterium]
FVRIDRRRGAVIAVDIDKLRALKEAEDILAVIFARTHCRGVTREEIHTIVDRIYDRYGERNGEK